MSSASSTLRQITKQLFRRKEDARLKALADVLESVPLFAPLSRGMLMELAEYTHEREYRRDEYLYYEGDPGIGLYIVRSGSVQLLVEDDDGAAEVVGQMGEYELLGAQCLLGGGVIRRAESAQATTETTVLGLFSPEYRTLQRRHPKTGAAIATLLARHFARCLAATRSLITEREGKLAAAACELSAHAHASAQAEPPPGW